MIEEAHVRAPLTHQELHQQVIELIMDVETAIGEEE
jgi:hypothetical protein